MRETRQARRGGVGLRLPAVAFLLAWACGSSAGASTSPPAGDARPAQSEPAVVVEFWLEMPGDDPDGFRIHEDGTWWSFTDRLATVDPGTGKVLIHEGHPQWAREEPRLTPEEVEGLRSLIRTSGVLKLPSEAPLHRESVDGDEGALVRWTFTTDGRAKRVRLHPDLDPMAPALKAVSDRIDALLDQARRRYLDSRGVKPVPRGP